MTLSTRGYQKCVRRLPNPDERKVSLESEQAAQRKVELHERLAGAIVQSEGAEDIIQRILDSLHQEFGFRRSLIYYHDQQIGLISVLGFYGFPKKRTGRITFMRTSRSRSVAGIVVKTGKPYFTPEAQTDENIYWYWRKRLCLRGPLLALPLKAGTSVCGVLVINDTRVTEDYGGLLEPFANDLAVAVTMVDQAKRLAAREEVIKLMAQAQSSFSEASVDEGTFLSKVADATARILNAQLCAIYRPAQANHTRSPATVFERKAAFGYPAEARRDRRTPATGPKQGLTNHVLAGEELNVPSVTEDRRWAGKQTAMLKRRLKSNIRAFLGIPLKDTSGQVIGGITLTRARVSGDDGLAFQEHDQDLIRAIGTGVASLLGTLDSSRSLRRHHAELDAIFNAVSGDMTDEVSVVDPDFTIRYVNRVKREKFKHDGELVGSKCYKVYEKRDRVCPRCPIRGAMEKALKGDFTPVRDSTHIGYPLGGGPYHASVVASAIADPRTGHVLGAVEVVRDLSQRQREVDEPIERGTHDILTFLDTIRSRLGTIKLDIQDGTIPDNETLQLHLERLKKLVSDADSFGRALFNASRQLVLNLEPHDVRKMVEDILKQEGVAYRLTCSRPSHPWITDCDRKRLSAVFLELLRNARKAVKPSKKRLSITVRLEPWLEGGEEQGLLLSFADNGPGIKVRPLDRIFERYFTTSRDGHGIGLYSAKRVIETHGGRINTATKKGFGAVFEIRLPKRREVLCHVSSTVHKGLTD
jgi:GAF domain-containing protein